MKVIETGKCRLLAVTVPEDSGFFKIDKDGHLSFDPDLTTPMGNWMTFPLPSGNWQILGFRDEITEEQAREVVEVYMVTGEADACWNYVKNRPYHDILESFRSLLASHNITDNVLILVEK